MPYAPTVTLRNGLELPMIGLGTYPMQGAECAAAVRTAIEAGYRLVDTAEDYGNEDGVGQGLRDSGLDRKDLVITTKFNRKWHSTAGVRQAWQASIERLGVEYVDLLLVHWPNPADDGYVDALRGLQALFDDGLIRAIGVSNFKPAHVQRVLDETGIAPEVNQIQLSPYTTRKATRTYDDAHGIVTESWSPIGGRGHDLRSDPLMVEVAKRYDKTPTQVVLRWHVQQGLVAIPKSGNPERIAENLDVFDFALTADEIAAIGGLDRGEGPVTDSDVFGH